MKKLKIFLMVFLFVSAAVAAFASKKLLVTGYIYRPTAAIKCEPQSVDCGSGFNECKIGVDQVRRDNNALTQCGPVLMKP